MKIRIKETGEIFNAIGPTNMDCYIYLPKIDGETVYIHKDRFEDVAELYEDPTPSLTDSIERLKPSRVIFEFNRESEEK